MVHCSSGARLLGAARTAGSGYTMVSAGSYPYCIRPGQGRRDCTPTAVLGELYECRDGTSTPHGIAGAWAAALRLSQEECSCGQGAG